MRNQKGFTLIELLIVVVIIGILAAIAIPKFSATREKAYYSAMKSDLKNLASQQEIYYSNHYTYSSDLDDLGFSHSDGVVIVAFQASSTGWAAHVTHKGIGEDETRGCAVFYGDESSPVSGAWAPTRPGQISCDQS